MDVSIQLFFFSWSEVFFFFVLLNDNGKRELKVKELEIIANALFVDVLYLLTYPHVYGKKERSEPTPIETVLQLKLSGEKRDQILKLIFGDNDLKLLT